MTCKFCNDAGCTACRVNTADDALRAEIAQMRVSLNKAEQHGEIMDAGLAILLAAIPMGEIVTAGANFPDLAKAIRYAYAARDGYRHTMTEARADLAKAYDDLEALREECARRAVVIDNLNAKIEAAKTATPEGLTPIILSPESERKIGYRALALVELEWRKPRGMDGVPESYQSPTWYFPQESDGLKLNSLARAWFATQGKPDEDQAQQSTRTHAAAAHLIAGGHDADELGIE